MSLERFGPKTVEALSSFLAGGDRFGLAANAEAVYKSRIPSAAPPKTAVHAPFAPFGNFSTYIKKHTCIFVQFVI